MQEETVQLLLGGIGAAVAGAIIGALLTAWANSRRDRDKERYRVDTTAQMVEMKNELIKTKEQFLYQLKDSFKEAQESVTLVRQTLKQAEKEGDEIRSVNKQAKSIVRQLEGKAGIDSEALAAILQPDVVRTLSSEIKQAFAVAAEKQKQLIKLLVATIAPRWEIEMLYRIAGDAPYIHNTSEPSDRQHDFRHHLGQLWGRGFVRQSHNEFLPWNQGDKNVKDWYQVSELGQQLIDLRTELGLDEFVSA